MKSYNMLPDNPITLNGPMSEKFLSLGLDSFQKACLFVHNIPYGYNTDKDNPMILFIENRGSCTTKHGVIATLAQELGIHLYKNVGVYKFTENIASGAQEILDKYSLPYVPMVHCFLVYNGYQFDLTEGNKNGKKTSIDEFIETTQVIPFITRKDEYLWFRSVLKDKIIGTIEMVGKSSSTILKAREDAIKLLKNNIE